MPEDDTLIFAEEKNERKKNSDISWKVLIVDDDDEIHHITKIVLGSCVILNRRLEFYSAFSAQEAKETLSSIDDIAIILLDVVMEKDDSGLQLVRYIREELHNNFVRIILRTGQPGVAPEEKIIVDYDINDYKAKTELTAQKLFTSLVSAIRAYRDIVTIEKNRTGLEKIIEASAKIFEIQNMKRFATAVLEQVANILQCDSNALYTKNNGFIAYEQNSDFIIFSASGKYQESIDQSMLTVIRPEIKAIIKKACDTKQSVFEDNIFACCIQSKSAITNIVLIENIFEITKLDLELIDIFCVNLSIAFDNILLNEEIEGSQKEIIFTLGELVEKRSHETGYHVKRVSSYATLIAQKLNLPENEIEIIKIGSAIHDVGKIAIPDGILNKPGKLDPAEFDIMKRHTTIGEELFKISARKIIHNSCYIVGQHHEKWDGTGYPRGLAQKDIHIYARITSIADVFDALSSDRVYRKALPVENAIDYIKQESGKQFDPELVDLFIANIDEIIRIKNLYTDA